MKYSKFFIQTLKEAPKDAVLASHTLLVRGGFIQQIGAGIYNFLPLGLRILEKISQTTREEMNKIGAVELRLGFITPSSLWQKSGRFERYGAELLRFKDRKDQSFVLGPTHEEAVVDCVSSLIKSYKQLPLNVYQIGLKFRDEARPRFGIMRAREFVMKDSYSFHSSYDDLVREFNAVGKAYERIFSRLGLDFRAVEADSGAIGGSGSREFMVLAEAGEDTICVCENCDYAANLEAAKRELKTCAAPQPKADFAKFQTPNIKSIESLSEFFKIDPFYILKCVAKWAIYDGGEKKAAFFFVRGSDNLNEIKAQNAANANELAELSEEELEQMGLCVGFLGPYSLRNITKSDLIFFDTELCESGGLICGANEKDYHFVGVDLAKFENLQYYDLVEVKEGDKCAKCGGSLRFTKGIEVGHIFQLGEKYSQAMGANFLDQTGKSKPFVMGCYGIGISRLLAAIIEQNHDERGCIWPKGSAPFLVQIIISNAKDAAQMEFGEKLEAILEERGICVLLDERDERFGAKMADFELIGIPFGIIIGKGLANGAVELVERKTLSKSEIKADLENIAQILSDLLTD